MVTWFKARCAGGGNVTFVVNRFWRAYIDGCSVLGVVYEVSLEVVMPTHA